MGRRIYRGLLLWACLLTLLSGCAGGLGFPEPTPQPTPVPTPMPTVTPAPLHEPLPLDLPPELSDGNSATWAGGYLRLHHEERKIGSVYLEWDRIPPQWTLLADGREIPVAENGFLHQYVELPEPAEEVVIQVDTPLCDVYAFEPGSVIPDWVQIWQPTLERADLLLLPTHADDEHVFFGGMMPYYAGELGYKVQVAYLTHHWKQAFRPHEQLDGLWTAGIRNYPVIGEFEDRWANSLEQAEERFDRQAVLEYQVELLRRFRPSVVVGHDLNGEYGHGVHILNAVTATEAVELAGDPTQFPQSAERYGTWDVPKLYLHLYPQGEILLDWNRSLTAFGGKTAFEVAREAFACHVTQQGYFYVYGDGDEHDSRRFGLYRSLVGPDLQGGDVFENIHSFY